MPGVRLEERIGGLLTFSTSSAHPGAPRVHTVLPRTQRENYVNQEEYCTQTSATVSTYSQYGILRYEEMYAICAHSQMLQTCSLRTRRINVGAIALNTMLIHSRHEDV